MTDDELDALIEDVEDGLNHRTTTDGDRQSIFFVCRSTMVNGHLKSGIQKELASQLGVSRMTVSRQWTAMNKKLAPLLINQPDASTHAEIIREHAHILFGDGKASRRKGKYKYDRDDFKEAVKAVDFKDRRSIRKLAAQVGVPKSTISDFMKPKTKEAANEQPVLFRHVSKLKPTLTEANRFERYLFASDQLNKNTIHLMRPKFLDQMDRVHIDEKWFNMCQDGEGYILVDGEEPPKRHVKHKNFIGKVLFLCAQARPWWDPHTNTQWDGKICIWPIGTVKPAERSSVHRPRGTLEWHNQTIDNDVYQDLLVNNVLTEVMNKWPVGQWNNPCFKVLIQQDGVGGHCSHKDDYLAEALEELGLTGKVAFYTQPPNSPDLNILDLGLFNALQAAYYDLAPRDAMELMTMVERTYWEFPYLKINRLFVMLQTVFNSIMEHNGGNEYKLVHMNKEKLEREGRLPVTIQCTFLP
jgi:hypothetical protein